MQKGRPRPRKSRVSAWTSPCCLNAELRYKLAVVKSGGRGTQCRRRARRRGGFSSWLTPASPSPVSAPSAACWRAGSTDGIAGLKLACVAAGDEKKARAWLDAQKIDCPVVPLEGLPEARRPRDRMRAVVADREHLPADAGGRQAGDGALVRRAAAAAGADRSRQGARRPHHRADRRAARSRRGDRLRRGH